MKKTFISVFKVLRSVFLFRIFSNESHFFVDCIMINICKSAEFFIFIGINMKEKHPQLPDVKLCIGKVVVLGLTKRDDRNFRKKRD